MACGLIDMEKQFAFYGAYHAHPVNVLIHICFVWPIFFTFLLLLAFTAPLYPLPLPFSFLPLQQYMIINWSFLVAAVYALFYASLDKKAGSLAAFMCIGCWIGSNALAQELGFSIGWKVAVVCQIVCWTGQLIGHGVFEGRTPAFVDNVFQAFLLAPFFVLLEVLQTLFNYEPYPGFRKGVQERVQSNIAKFKAKNRKAA